MNKKTYELIVGINGGVATIACAVVAFIHPDITVQIVAGIGIVSTAINEVCALFVKPDAKIEK